MRDDSTSERVARIPGNSVRKKRNPWRTATPRSNRKARIWLMMPVRWPTSRSRTRCSACKSSWSTVLVATNFIVGRCTASAIASASRKSFFCPFEYGARISPASVDRAIEVCGSGDANIPPCLIGMEARRSWLLRISPVKCESCTRRTGFSTRLHCETHDEAFTNRAHPYPFRVCLLRLRTSGRPESHAIKSSCIINVRFPCLRALRAPDRIAM
jgi:hypothetical protein